MIMGGKAQPQFFLFLDFITVDVVLFMLKMCKTIKIKNRA